MSSKRILLIPSWALARRSGLRHRDGREDPSERAGHCRLRAPVYGFASSDRGGPKRDRRFNRRLGGVVAPGLEDHDCGLTRTHCSVLIQALVVGRPACPKTPALVA